MVTKGKDIKAHMRRELRKGLYYKRRDEANKGKNKTEGKKTDEGKECDQSKKLFSRAGTVALVCACLNTLFLPHFN